MKHHIETYIVDSFTDKPFKGNPAGVCILEEALNDEQMLSIAKELGLSETAFVILLSKPNTYRIRFFSPVIEIPLCGHATLASSKVLFEIDREMESIHFKNMQDLNLKIKKHADKIEMKFPIQFLKMLQKN